MKFSSVTEGNVIIFPAIIPQMQCICLGWIFVIATTNHNSVCSALIGL